MQFELSLPISIANSTRKHTVYVVPQLWRPCIIGNDLIQKHNLQIDGGRQHAYFKRPEKHELRPEITHQERKNDDTYTLLAVERVKIPPHHAFNLQVRPNKTILQTKEHMNEEEYEIISLKATPSVANGIVTPRNNITVQVANFTERMIFIQVNQPLALMTRLNQTQINMIHHDSTLSPENVGEHTPVEEPNLINTDLTNIQKEQIKQLIQKYPKVFTKNPGRTTQLKHQINLIPGSKPYNSPPFRYAPARRQVIDEQTDEMLQQGIIQPSTSPWASPVILAPKKDGTLRFCIDYRKLNAMTVRDAYPIPRIDDTLDSLQEAKFISTLDLRSGYWQVEMEKESREKTAFVTHKGLFEFKVMPFGLTNAPATFQRLMDIVLAGLKWNCCLVYIDDVVIYSPTFEQHLIDLDNVFKKLQVANLTLKASKCQLCRREMRYLGHIITSQGTKPDPDLIKSVINFPLPKKVKDIQSFLGLTGYYRRFIRDYAKVAEPLLKQLRNCQQSNHQVKWNQECTLAFQTLKQKLTNAPIMNTPNFAQPFILELDACEYGLGAVLVQEYDDKKYVIAYGSRTLSNAERKYGATEREALAIVWATKHFRPYLEGNKILIRSDCKALEWMRNAKDVTGRLARWAMKLSAFQIEIQYRPGKTNANADSLSRNPLPPETEPTSEISTIETVIDLWSNTNILDNIRNEQQADTKLLPIIQKLATTPAIEFNEKRNPYALINGILYKIKNSNRHYNQRVLGNKHLIVIPKSMHHKLLQWAHDHPFAGHSGQQKTLFRLNTRVFWESMRKDVYNYVKACESCQQFKYDNAPLSNTMQIHAVNEPWNTIGIDIMGPFPPTVRNKRFLLVIVDYFTRWIEVFALSSTTSSAISEVLIDQVFARYGFPKYILSDNGPQFVSNLFRNFCETLKIEQKFTANYHPQTNMTERVNRTLKPLLAIYAQKQPHSWDKEIHKLAFAIRSSINDTTGETPAFLMFGRDIRGPLDLIIGDSTANLPPPTTLEEAQIHNYKENLIKTLRSTYNLVIERSEIEKYNQKRKYDHHTTIRHFTVGDLVWVTIPTSHVGDNTISGKLHPHYQGPCRLMKQLSPSTFIVRRLRDNVDLGATNVDRLKPYYESEYTPKHMPEHTLSSSPSHTDTSEKQENQQRESMNKNSTEQQPMLESRPSSDTISRKISSRQRRQPARYRD